MKAHKYLSNFIWRNWFSRSSQLRIEHAPNPLRKTLLSSLDPLQHQTSTNSMSHGSHTLSKLTFSRKQSADLYQKVFSTWLCVFVRRFQPHLQLSAALFSFSTEFWFCFLDLLCLWGPPLGLLTGYLSAIRAGTLTRFHRFLLLPPFWFETPGAPVGLNVCARKT